jgi:hypothetical protein
MILALVAPPEAVRAVLISITGLIDRIERLI